MQGAADVTNAIVQTNSMLHGDVTEAWSDADRQGAEKRPVLGKGCDGTSRCNRERGRQLDKSQTIDALTDKLERFKACTLAKVEHPFRVIKCQFGQAMGRYRGLIKNTAHLRTVFALPNLWTAQDCYESRRECAADRRKVIRGLNASS
jgi:IS5 family transposase